MESVLNKINALLNKTIENGATEAEAASALAMAQRLMTQHMIEAHQLAEHAKDKTCKQITIPMFKTPYDTKALNGYISDAFDCKCWWQDRTRTVHFFGFGEDARLAAYFYNYLNNVIVNDAYRFHHSREYRRQRATGYHGKTILASFRKGMIIRLCERLEELKAERVSNVQKTTGTNLVVVKEDRVKEEFEGLNLKLRSVKSNLEFNSAEAFASGVEFANNVNMSGGIEGKTEDLRLQITK